VRGCSAIASATQSRTKKETATRAASISRVSAWIVRSAPCLDDRCFPLANRSLAFAPAAGEAEREYNRANNDYKLFHDFTPVSKFIEKYRYFLIYN
jgi:hypothetical protein